MSFSEESHHATLPRQARLLATAFRAAKVWGRVFSVGSQRALPTVGAEGLEALRLRRLAFMTPDYVIASPQSSSSSRWPSARAA
jgi:hypothetical protein